MVTTTSPLVQTHYESDKRKKHTLEKAKVTHLTRQLQLRLQYAKLKVDHGWQRQNLNEVENLYFHHSHMRVPKLQLMRPAAVAERHTGKKDARTKTDRNEIVQAGAIAVSPTHQSIAKTTDLPPTLQVGDNAVSTSPSVPITIDDSSTCNVPSSPSQHSFTNLIQALVNSCQKPGPAQQTKSPLHSRTSSSSVSFISNDTLSTPSKTGTTQSFFTSSPNTALTYDSFWSSHNSARPFRSSSLSLLSSTDPEVQALLSGLSGRDISSYLTNSSDFMTSSSRPANDAAPSALTSMTGRNLPTIAEASEGG